MPIIKGRNNPKIMVPLPVKPLSVSQIACRIDRIIKSKKTPKTTPTIKLNDVTSTFFIQIKLIICPF